MFKTLADFDTKFKEWSLLTDKERAFFFGDEYLPLPRNHANRISIIKDSLALKFTKIALDKVPTYSINSDANFKNEMTINLDEVWGKEQKIQDVRNWLFERGIPFSRTIYLLYSDIVVKTDWKTLVNYWDAFGDSVGVEMLAIDSTKSWLCSFHHENVITFYSYY
ncbi:MAG: hypothetical protein AAF490_10295 [Chloroflexota bacterium]